MPAQHVLDVVQLHRLGQEVVHAGLPGALARLGEGVGRQRDHRHARVRLRHPADLARRLQPVHRRHMHVHQHQVEAGGLQALQRLGPVAGQADPVPEALEQNLHVLAVDRMVVGDQHTQLAAGRHRAGRRQRHRRRLGRLLRGDLGRVERTQRQQHAELAALPRLADDLDVAAHHPHQLARDLQPQPGAAEAPADAVVALAEALEQALQRLLVHADAGVDDADARQRRPGGAVLRRHRVDQQPHAAAVGELDRVADQVEQHLLEPLRVRLDPDRQVRRQRHLEQQRARARLRLHQRPHVLDELVQVERMGRELEPAGLQLGQVEHVVEDVQQVLAGLARDLQVLALLRIERRAVQQRHHAQQAVEGRAQLVAHVGQEGALGAAGLLGLEPGLLQPRGELLELDAALLERAHLAHHDDREHQDQQALEDGQADADAVLLAHALVAADDARTDGLVRQQREVAHRRRQRVHVGQHRAQRRHVHRRRRVRPEHRVDAGDDRVELPEHPAVLGQVGHDLAGAHRIDQADAADEDVVALAQRFLAAAALGRRQRRHLAHEVVHLAVEPEVFGLELEEAPDDVVALVDDLGAEQPQRLRLQPGDAAEDQRQQQRHGQQQPPDSGRSAGGGRRREAGHSTSSILSCQAERL